MTSIEDFRFGPFLLDRANQTVRRGQTEIRLAPRAFAVLLHLVEHAGQLVTKIELFDAVWQGTAVGDAALTFSIGEVRRALGDEAKAARYVETIHRRGYRFIADVQVVSPSATAHLDAAANARAGMAALVGREREIERLGQIYARAAEGNRQITLVAGEPGIGKTTLVDSFLERLQTPEADIRVTIGRGQCIEHYGAGEPYLPMLEALTRLCRDPRHQELKSSIASYAPSWLLQMPSVTTTDELIEAKQRSQDAGADRMLREMLDALEAVACERPLVLVLEDLHWSDHATVELLAALVRRREPAQLMIVGTYRPVDVILAEHPLRDLHRDLLGRGQLEEILLDFLDVADVERYLHGRFPNRDVAALRRSAETIHRHTEGNPLFMACMIDHLEESEESHPIDVLVSSADALPVPTTLAQMLDRRIEMLDATDRQLVEVASIIGRVFSTAALAPVLGLRRDEVEQRCEGLARHRQLLERSGELRLPDGAVGSSYAFTHVLYQHVLNERLAPGARAELHRRIAEQLEQLHAGDPALPASELAVHYEAAGDVERALGHRVRAAQQSLERNAHWEAAEHLASAIENLQRLPANEQRRVDELLLTLQLGVSLVSGKGYASSECLAAFARGDELIEQTGERDHLHLLLPAYWTVNLTRGQYAAADKITLRHLALANESDDAIALRWAHFGRCQVCLYTGRFAAALEHAKQILADATPSAGPLAEILQAAPIDPIGATLADFAALQWYLGCPTRARETSAAALDRIGEEATPLTTAYVLSGCGFLARLDGRVDEVLRLGTRLTELAIDYRLNHYRGAGDVLSGWARAHSGEPDAGCARVRDGIERQRAAEAQILLTHYAAMLADCHVQAGRYDDALAAVDEALSLVADGGERYHESELHRMRGEITLVADRGSATARATALEAFDCALQVATEQGALGWQLRAAIERARLLSDMGRSAEAIADLTPIVAASAAVDAGPGVARGRAVLRELKNGADSC